MLNWLKYLRLRSNITYVILGTSFILALTGYFYNKEFDEKLESFKHIERENNFDLSRSIQGKFDQAYRELRTIARLPGITNLNLHEKQLPIDTKIAIQEIYNNIYETVHVSELYITPIDFNPDRIDPRTQKPETPVATFDEYITSQTPSALQMKEKKEIEEIEIYEYQVMKSQLQYLQQNYANIKSIDNLNYPMLSSSEVITCDNSNIDPKNIIDEKRKGFVFSVPYYDKAGHLAGIISGVILKSVLNGFLTVTNDQDDKYSLSQAANNIRLGFQPKTNILYFDFFENIDLHDPLGDWKLTAKIPESVFIKSEVVTTLYQKYAFIIFIFLILSASLISHLLHLEKIRHWNELRKKELKEALEKRTAELEESSQNLVQATKLTALGEMAASIAHEISNPLAVIHSKAERINQFVLNSRENLATHDTSCANLTKIKEASDKVIQMTLRVEKIIKNLRSFARKGDKDPMIRFPVKTIIEETMDLVDPRKLNKC